MTIRELTSEMLVQLAQSRDDVPPEPRRGRRSDAVRRGATWVEDGHKKMTKTALMMDKAER